VNECETLGATALKLSRELPASAVNVRRALRTAAHWGSFPLAYTAEHHALGLCVLDEVVLARARFRETGKLPAQFTAAARALVESADAEGLKF
jgi:hypothetical protein